MLPLSKLSELPTSSGIYLVESGFGTILYVGQAQNIRARWLKGHHKFAVLAARDDFLSIRIRWVNIPKWLLNRAENAAVSHYQPVLNKRMPPVV